MLLHTVVWASRCDPLHNEQHDGITPQSRPMLMKAFFFLPMVQLDCPYLLHLPILLLLPPTTLSVAPKWKSGDIAQLLATQPRGNSTKLHKNNLSEEKKSSLQEKRDIAKFQTPSVVPGTLSWHKKICVVTLKKREAHFSYLRFLSNQLPFNRAVLSGGRGVSQNFNPIHNFSQLCWCG